MSIHPTAIVDPSAELAADVEVGPYAVIGAAVRIGAGTRVDHHASVLGPAEIGACNQVFPFASIGSAPQDVSYRGEPTRLVIGDRNVFREFVTVNRGTLKEEGVTRIGNDNLLMAYAHVAHDCVLGDGIWMANCATLAGHVHIADFAIVGGLSAVQQWSRIGRVAYIGGLSGVTLDAPPFAIVSGQHASLFGLNLVGLQRRGFSEETIQALKKAFRILFRSGHTLKTALAKTEQEVPPLPEVTELLDFLRSAKRGVVRPASRGAAGE